MIMFHVEHPFELYFFLVAYYYVSLMKAFWFFKAALPVLCLALSGCDTTESTMGGTALGTAAGAGIGYAFGGKGGAVAGGIIGGLGGGTAGHAIGRKQEESKQRAAYVEENARLRAQNAALLDDDYRQKRMQNVQKTQYSVADERSWQEHELQQLNFEVEKARLENERLRYELEREQMRKK